MELPNTPSFRLDGKRAFVTGATSGIGLGCAVALAEQGAFVTLVARNKTNLAATAAAFKLKNLECEILPLDISDVAAVEAELNARGAYNILVNCAGLARHSPATQTSYEDFDAVMGLNLRGAYFLTRAIAKKLIAEGLSGSLINMSSQMGHVGGVDRAVYCASKHAVEGFTKAMAVEFGPDNIRINTICPTFIRTPLGEQTLKNPKALKWVTDKIKLGRIGEVDDIMGAVIYLASDASALVTGTALLVDGGWTAD
ncbi:MAG: SDR family oxidoreductase [Rhizobiales bacterium]|nr:SDR family oxidoreductase [Hyphomicrobiales bacterium]